MSSRRMKTSPPAVRDLRWLEKARTPPWTAMALRRRPRPLSLPQRRFWWGARVFSWARRQRAGQAC